MPGLWQARQASGGIGKGLLSPAVRAWIGVRPPVSGWLSLVVSFGGILAVVLALVTAAALNSDRSVPVGVAVLAAALGLSVAGWGIGNRHHESAEPSTEEARDSFIALVPDGRTVGKVGVLLVVVTLASGVVGWFLLVAAFSHLVIY